MLDPLDSIPITALQIAAAACFALMLVGGFLIAPRNRLASRNNAPLPMQGLGKSPILQVELARSEDDLRAVLMTGDTSQNVRDARAGNLLDTFLFIPGYSGFLLATGELLRRMNSPPQHIPILLALGAIPVAAICDWLENLGIARALNHIAQDQAPHPGDALRIAAPSMVKWTLLAIVAVIYGLTAIGSGGGWLVVAFGVLLLAVGTLLTFRLINYFRQRFG